MIALESDKQLKDEPISFIINCCFWILDKMNPRFQLKIFALSTYNINQQIIRVPHFHLSLAHFDDTLVEEISNNFTKKKHD